jgi:LuxR family quorum sensing-dependent transcriptional regulator
VSLEETIATIESCSSLQELESVLHSVAERYGFVGFNFLDIGRAADAKPFYFGTSGKSWEAEYANNNFVRVDPCLHAARQNNLPFRWDEVPLPPYKTGRKPGAIKTIEAAQDHGFTNGLVVPHHFVDEGGQVFSVLVVFFWKDCAQKMLFKLQMKSRELHLITIYWINQATLLRKSAGSTAFVLKPRFDSGKILTLSDRERDVLSRAVRGKTNYETAAILKISVQTVEFHLRNAAKKLNAVNKTQAAAKALTLGLVSI